MSRQTGWYRVKSKGIWSYAYFDDLWRSIEHNYLLTDSYFDEINEEPQNPEPPKKTGLDGDGYPIEVK